LQGKALVYGWAFKPKPPHLFFLKKISKGIDDIYPYFFEIKYIDNVLPVSLVFGHHNDAHKVREAFLLGKKPNFKPF